MIFDRGYSLEPARLYCLSCGREERMPEEQKKEERICKECGQPTGRKSDLCKKCYIRAWHKENDPKIDPKPKRKYTRHANLKKKKLLPAIRAKETMPEKSTVMFKALRRAILLDFLEEIGRQL